MGVETKDVVLYQIMNCLVENYSYDVIRFNGQKEDLWLTNRNQDRFPVIRLSQQSSSSLLYEKEYLDKIQSFLKRFMRIEKEILIINTNSDSEIFEEDGYLQLLANEDRVDNLINNIFPLLKDAIHPVENGQVEIDRINQHLRQLQTKRIREQQRANRKVPKFTLGIIAVVALIFAFTVFFSQYMMSGSNADNNWVNSLILFGAYYKPFVIAGNEYWRFFTSGLLHLNLIHMLVNVISLYYLGMMIESMYKKWQYLVILIVSIIVGSAITFVVSDTLMAVGISGGLYGLLAAMILFTFHNNSIQIPQVRNSVMRILMINLLISVLPGVSMSDHLGGFFTGAILGFLFISSEKWKAYKPHVAICFVILIAGVGYLGINNHTVSETTPGTDKQVLGEIRKLGLGGYADYLEKGLERLYSE